MAQKASVSKSKKNYKKKSRERPKSEEKKEKTKFLFRSPVPSSPSSSKASPSSFRTANNSKSSVKSGRDSSQSPKQPQSSKKSVNSSKRRSSANRHKSSKKSGSTKTSDNGKSGKTSGQSRHSTQVISKDVILRNQRQIELIIYMLEGVRIDLVTKGNKDDLDKVQLLVKNIIYREMGLWQKVRPVVFTKEQLELFKVVLDEETPSEGAAKGNPAESSSSITLLKSKAKEKRSPVHLSYPYKKLTFVPTVRSMAAQQVQRPLQVKKKKQASKQV